MIKISLIAGVIVILSFVFSLTLISSRTERAMEKIMKNIPPEREKSFDGCEEEQ